MKVLRSPQLLWYWSLQKAPTPLLMICWYIDLSTAAYKIRSIKWLCYSTLNSALGPSICFDNTTTNMLAVWAWNNSMRIYCSVNTRSEKPFSLGKEATTITTNYIRKYHCHDWQSLRKGFETNSVLEMKITQPWPMLSLRYTKFIWADSRSKIDEQAIRGDHKWHVLIVPEIL